MPATRAARRAHHHSPLRVYEAPPPDSDIIVLSSDDDDCPPKKKPAPKKTTKHSPKYNTRATSAAAQEVVEISSEDETSTSNVPHRTITSLRQQLKDAREEVERLRSARDEAHSEVAKLKADVASHDQVEAKSKNIVAELDDYLSCEICTLKMWTPYTLACGHTFCETCLADWFNTALVTHKAAHPQTYAALQTYRNALRDAGLPAAARRQLQVQVSALVRHQPAPSYTCPTCRAPVTARPAAVFALKHVVRVVAGAMGEQSPKKPAPAPAHMHAGPWDAFFDP
ncbi:hypothetical protein B0H21DRAFT_425025 [Amylocystis lapponica]|nr:hypothetical protein B0H21DRAFT_425025 [Amylocystis lapponica]